MLDLNAVDNIFNKLSERVTFRVNVVLCGGVSMLINYGNRKSTLDVDCLRVDSKLQQIANEMAPKIGMKAGWLNDDVSVTCSYSPELFLHTKLWKTFGNINVYTISDIYLLCMKLVAFREDSHDRRDCKCIIKCIKDTQSITDVYTCIEELYGGTHILSADAEEFLRKEFDVNSLQLDNDSVASIAFMISSGLQTLEELPEEFREQVRKYLYKEEASCI